MKNTRNVTTKTLTLGTPETITLPRNYAHRSLVLRLNGTVDVADTATDMTQLSQGAANLLSNIRVRRDGKDTVYSLGGLLTYELNKILYGVAPAQTLVSVTTNATNQTVTSILRIPFENLLGVKPFDTLLKGPGLSSLDLIVDTQSAQNLAYTPSGGGTITVNSAFTLEVNTIEETGVNDFVFGDIRTYLAQKVQVSGASNNFQIKPISVGNYYKGFMLFVEDTGVPSNNVISNIKLKSGSEVFYDRPATAVRAENQLDYRIGTLSTGVYYIDLMPDGFLNQCLDVTPASGRESLEFELVTSAPSGTCYVYVVALEYIPPAVVQKQPK